MGEQNNYASAGPHNIIINKKTTVGHHTFNMTTEENPSDDPKVKTPADREEPIVQVNQDEQQDVPEPNLAV